MNKHRRHTLMPIDQFRNIFKPMSVHWNENDYISVRLIHPSHGFFDWYINSDMMKRFGKTYDFIKNEKTYKKNNYDYYYIDGFEYHSLWFIDNLNNSVF